ncbi:unnamed protein product [Echinostoma caproni]|uniref:C2 NT-type domain-containing protein n=1 Tax=Echinostoma caproni TaxID=27848 RepID=A0A183B6S8_9TREM|nr:unnamed protein product [Echinostoma caproni]
MYDRMAKKDKEMQGDEFETAASIRLKVSFRLGKALQDNSPRPVKVVLQAEEKSKVIHRWSYKLKLASAPAFTQHIHAPTRKVDEKKSILYLVLSPRQSDVINIGLLISSEFSDCSVLRIHWRRGVSHMERPQDGQNVERSSSPDMHQVAKLMDWDSDSPENADES